MKPPERIPDNMLDEYTMGGIIDVEYSYRDDSSWEVQSNILSKYTTKSFQKYCDMARRRKKNYYGKTDNWLYQAIEKYPIKDKSVCVFGSACPWYEAICISYGASLCHVLEYSPRPSFDERVKYINDNELIKYDAVFSISSFEHYGLGRYGDVLEPNGDVNGMHVAHSILNDDGILFLSVPIGVDKLYFNVHRVYGKYRLGLLINGFSIIDNFGMDKNSFHRTDNNAKGTPYQPIIVLRK